MANDLSESPRADMSIANAGAAAGACGKPSGSTFSMSTLSQCHSPSIPMSMLAPGCHPLSGARTGVISWSA